MKYTIELWQHIDWEKWPDWQEIYQNYDSIVIDKDMIFDLESFMQYLTYCVSNYIVKQDTDMGNSIEKELNDYIQGN